MDAVEAPPGPALAPVPGRPLPRTPRELYDALPPLPGLQTEVIDGRLVTRLRDAPEYASAAMQLFEALLPLMDDRGLAGVDGKRRRVPRRDQ
ncbi:hypothetical protein [Microbispora sp. NPDC046933]|uniref:hypothetical protein n=1 Tax=Microbispora sp. NPDC046933 TaxID=3155618 RepID=UPI0033FA2795